MIPDSETLERAIRRCALGCAQAVIADRDPSPLWREAVELIEARLSGGLVETEFRRQAALLECQFPLLVALTGVRNGDPHAAAALVVSAARNQNALEAALGASRNERLHARSFAAAKEAHLAPKRGASMLVGVLMRCRLGNAVFYCLKRPRATEIHVLHR